MGRTKKNPSEIINHDFYACNHFNALFAKSQITRAYTKMLRLIPLRNRRYYLTIQNPIYYFQSYLLKRKIPSLYMKMKKFQLRFYICKLLSLQNINTLKYSPEA